MPQSLSARWQGPAARLIQSLYPLYLLSLLYLLSRYPGRIETIRTGVQRTDPAIATVTFQAPDHAVELDIRTTAAGKRVRNVRLSRPPGNGCRCDARSLRPCPECSFLNVMSRRVACRTGVGAQ